MQSNKAVASSEPSVIQQWNLFGGCDEIPINPLTTAKPGKPAKPAPAESTVKSIPRVEVVVPISRRVVVEPSKRSVEDLDYEGISERIDDGVRVDLEAIHPDDTPEMLLAKRMFLRMLWDLKLKPELAAKADLFGQSAATNQGEQDQLDALIWMYRLNPDGSLVPFDWVCDVLGYNADRVRRVAGRSMRSELKRLVNLLSTIISENHARECVLLLSDFVDVSTWRFN